MQTANGELAQLARAFDWQSRGHRFEPGILHKTRNIITMYPGFLFANYVVSCLLFALKYCISQVFYFSVYLLLKLLTTLGRLRFLPQAWLNNILAAMFFIPGEARSSHFLLPMAFL